MKTKLEPLLVEPQETWNRKTCLKMSRRPLKDGLGTAYPYRGLISLEGSPYPSYGQTRRFNGGIIRDGILYKAHHVPFPKIHKDFEIVHRLSWGHQIKLKDGEAA